jgi:hypothetical protein
MAMVGGTWGMGREISWTLQMDGSSGSGSGQFQWELLGYVLRSPGESRDTGKNNRPLALFLDAVAMAVSRH